MALWKKTDTANGAPVSLSESDADKVYLVDDTEVGVTANRAKGLKTPGWNLYNTYTDADGNTRHKVETLVAFAEATAADTGDTGAIVINATSIEDAVEYTIVTAGTTDFTTVGAANSDPGVTFTANGTPTGTGTVSPSEDDTVADS